MRRRVLAASLLATLSALFVLGIPLGFMLIERNYREAVLALDREATAAERLLPEVPTTRPVAFHPADGDVQIGLYNTAGVLIGGRGPKIADSPTRRAVTTGESVDNRSAGRVVLAVPVDVGGDNFGVIRAEDQSNHLSGRDRRAWIVLGVLGVLGVGASSAAALLLSRRLTGPAGALSLDAGRLGDGDFTVRFRASGIPELETISSALARSAQRLSDATQRERAFSADASHQLKTPMASLRLAIEAELHAPGGNRQRAFEDLLIDVDRLEATVTDLLVLARDTHGDRDRIDLGALAREATRRAEQRSRERKFVLSIEGSPEAFASATAIDQALDVLLDNALVHGAGLIAVSVRESRGGVVVAVSDEGRQRIDERVMVQRRADTARGHGIGLALARRVVEAEGGQLRLTHAGPAPRFEILIPS